MNFIAVQFGARRGYAVPKFLAEASLLERFYTDICGSIGLGAALGVLNRLPFLGNSFSRLSQRRLPDAIVQKTRTFAGPIGKKLLRSVYLSRDAKEQFRAHMRYDQEIGTAMIRAGYGNATHVFSMLAEASPFLIEARRRGLKVVNEVYILISTEKVLAEERRAFPGWELEQQDFDSVRREFCKRDPLLTETDLAVCPSEAVRDDLVINHGFDINKTVIVPYGMNPKWLELEPKPRRGAILFVGTAELRKGIHYLAQAAELLKARGCRYEFRVAGNVTPRVAAQPICRNLNFLGRVPRDQIHEEFRTADVFVLPTLAEGSAEVTYEALAAGLPVVTTRAAGSVVRDGIEGSIVPERDSQALADAIQETVENRLKREQLAQAGRDRAREFTWDHYGERLITALRTMETQTA